MRSRSQKSTAQERSSLGSGGRANISCLKRALTPSSLSQHTRPIPLYPTPPPCHATDDSFESRSGACEHFVSETRINLDINPSLPAHPALYPALYPAPPPPCHATEDSPVSIIEKSAWMLFFLMACPRAGWVSTLLSGWLRKQCDHPAPRDRDGLRDQRDGVQADQTAAAAISLSLAMCCPPGRVGQHVAIGMAREAVQPPGPRTHLPGCPDHRQLLHGHTVSAYSCTLGTLHRECSCKLTATH